MVYIQLERYARTPAAWLTFELAVCMCVFCCAVVQSYAVDSILEGADMTNAVVDRVDFSRAKLKGAKFINAVVTGEQRLLQGVVGGCAGLRKWERVSARARPWGRGRRGDQNKPAAALPHTSRHWGGGAGRGVYVQADTSWCLCVWYP